MGKLCLFIPSIHVLNPLQCWCTKENFQRSDIYTGVHFLALYTARVGKAKYIQNFYFLCCITAFIFAFFIFSSALFISSCILLSADSLLSKPVLMRFILCVSISARSKENNFSFYLKESYRRIQHMNFLKHKAAEAL